MITPVEISLSTALPSADSLTLRNRIDEVLRGSLPGFVIDDSDMTAFQKSVRYATNIGLNGGINSTTMTFNYDSTVHELASGMLPAPEDWEQFGITPLHADGEEGEKMLSISTCSLGGYAIYIANRGLDILDESPVELWDSLHDESVRILTENRVDTDKLSNQVTKLDVVLGQTVIFNPSRPHMGVTARAPRRVNTTFFHTESD